MPEDDMAKTISAKDVFLSGLRNAHAMERQALAILQPQVNRLQHYPEVSALLQRHIEETEGQLRRLDEVLEQVDASASGFKDTATALSGTLAALGHTMADDEILKNTFANHAFENFEIAAYVSLITTADLCGASSATLLLQQNLDEERRMAAALHDSIEAVTRRYVELGGSDERADI
jgi:ferritin-like metal-binding protein YciE